MVDQNKEKVEKKRVSRRDFLKDAGIVVGGVAVASGLAACSQQISAGPTPTVTETVEVTKEVKPTYAASKGYLVVDSRKCAGCLSCMMACSLAHEGENNLSLSRIQITQDSFERYPFDTQQHQCLQCPTPLCVINCPSGACHIDPANGNVRVIDQSKCIGCQTCIKSCPQQPHRTIWNPVAKKASKCDLCIDAPYLKETGGPGGTQACVAVCPMQAIKFTDVMPADAYSYNVNLRNENAKEILLIDDPIPIE